MGILSVIFENSTEIQGKQLKWLLWRDFLPLASWRDMDDAAVAPSDHFRQLALTESSVYVSYELQWCQYGDCRGMSHATTHMFPEIFENLTKIR